MNLFCRVGGSGRRLGVCAPGSCESMRGRKGRLLFGSTWSNFNFPSVYVGGVIKFASGISNLAKMSVERARLLSVMRVRDWLFRELNFAQA